MTNALTIEELTYRKNWKKILSDVNLTVPAGQIIGLLGANGAGKTSLMRLIAGAAAHFQGSIEVAGIADPIQRKGAVSYSAQLAGIDDGLRLSQIVKQVQALFPDFRMKDYQQLAKLLDLSANQRLKQLSKGGQRKFALAVTLARNAQLYLLDEPFDGIDVMTRKAMLKSILKWTPESASMVISDHHVGDIEQLLDQVVVLKDQTIAAQEAADTIREHGQSVEEYFESFYGGENHDQID